MNINKELKNPLLTRAIELLQSNYSSRHEHTFYDELLVSELLCPAIIREKNKINIIKITDNAEMTYMSAFTDWENYAAYPGKKDYQAIVFSMNDYMRILTTDLEVSGIVINPYTHNLVLSRKNIESMKASMGNIKKNETVSIGLPKEYPDHLAKALSNYFNKTGYVESAYLLQIVRNDIEKSYLLVIKSDNDYEQVFSEIGNHIKKILKHDEIIDFVPFNTEFGKKAVNGYDPFFIDS